MSLSTTLVGFTRLQIGEALEKRLGEKSQLLLESMPRIYEMMDYAGRPLLLSLMVDIFELPENPFDLYQTSYRQNFSLTW